MTQEQLKLYDAAFEAKVDYKPHSETEHFSEYFEHGFRVGGRAILDNPGEWGLCSLEIHKQAVKTFDEITVSAINDAQEASDERNRVVSQLTKYREALERIVEKSERLEDEYQGRQNEYGRSYDNYFDRFCAEEEIGDNPIDWVKSITTVAKEALKQQ